MSELKAFDITVAEEGYCEGIVKYRRAVYDKSEADAVIAELKDKLRHYPIMVALLESDKKELEKKNKEIKTLRRALYKACANWANCKACILEYFGNRLYAKKWERMIHNCQAKAKELTDETRM